MSKPAIGVIGASGYTGSELVRLLARHPEVTLKIITSQTYKGQPISDIHPHLLGIHDTPLVSADDIDNYDLDLVFLALPHGVSMKFVHKFRDKSFKIVDLSGDFRLSSSEVYTEWYHMPHVCPDLIEGAVYGLPELFREQIVNTRLVANPGCYPTASILATAPLIKHDLIEKTGVIVDAKSGITGAGAKAKPVTHYPSANENVNAYGIGRHRHTPEIEEVLSAVTDTAVNVLFTPHLVPLSRGLLVTAYTQVKDDVTQSDIDAAYQKTYGDEPFIRIREKPVSVQAVRGSNYTDVYAILDPRTRRIISGAAIDNLVKGASGAAVQNMNLMLSFDEMTGLEAPPLAP